MSNKYIEYFKIGFRKSIEYKSYLLSVFLTPLFMGIFFYFVWSYIYSVKGGGDSEFLIGGFTFTQMLVYLIIGLLINVSRSSEISQRISETIKSGDIAIYLCRPVNFVKSLLADSIGSKVIYFFAFLLLLGIMTNLLGLPYPAGTLMILFVIYAIMFLIFDTIVYAIIGGLAFWFTEIWGIRNAVEQIWWILSGRILPLSLFPIWFVGIIQWTPFYYLEYTLSSTYLGVFSINEVLKALGIFAIWILIFALIMVYIYRKGFKKMEALGG
jgi:ABC-2 type transport system permease protein